MVEKILPWAGIELGPLDQVGQHLPTELSVTRAPWDQAIITEMNNKSQYDNFNYI